MMAVTAPAALACAAEHHQDLQQVLWERDGRSLGYPGADIATGVCQMGHVKKWCVVAPAHRVAAGLGPVPTLQLTRATALQPVSGQDRVHPMLLLVSDSEKAR